MDPIAFHVAVMAYCYRFRASTTSGGRTNKHNAAVGGVPDSKHQVWLGTDVVYDDDGPPPLEKAQAAAAQLGLKVIREGDHDHLQP